jgi:predicted TIM-barrel enzyme
MAQAGADIVVCHLGLTTGGAIGAETALKLADCVAPINAWAAAAKAVNPEVIVLCHGGPIATPDDAQYILRIARPATASTAPVRWSGCPPRWR